MFEQSKGQIGSRGLVKRLRRKGVDYCDRVVGRYLVRALMREQGLVCRIRCAYRGRGGGAVVGFPNHLAAGVASAPDQQWSSDITYLKTRAGATCAW